MTPCATVAVKRKPSSCTKVGATVCSLSTDLTPAEDEDCRL
jgi:hypothetical protein